VVSQRISSASMLNKIFKIGSKTKDCSKDHVGSQYSHTMDLTPHNQGFALQIKEINLSQRHLRSTPRPTQKECTYVMTLISERVTCVGCRASPTRHLQQKVQFFDSL
jgi:hypothetical protein